MTSRMSIWPNRTWSRIGIRYVHAAVSRPSATGDHRPANRPSGPSRAARNACRTVTASATKMPAVQTHWATGQDIQASGMASSTAIGG